MVLPTVWPKVATLQMRVATVPIPLPDTVYTGLRRLYRGWTGRAAERVRDLSGDRAIEWSWVAARVPEGSGREALDFGCGNTDLSLIAANRGFDVTAVDLDAVRWPYQHDRMTFVQGDILELSLGAERFDLVLNCSTVEHVGLAGRYGVTKEEADGDLQAMRRLRDLM